MYTTRPGPSRRRVHAANPVLRRWAVMSEFSSSARGHRLGSVRERWNSCEGVRCPRPLCRCSAAVRNGNEPVAPSGAGNVAADTIGIPGCPRLSARFSLRGFPSHRARDASVAQRSGSCPPMARRRVQDWFGTRATLVGELTADPSCERHGDRCSPSDGRSCCTPADLDPEAMTTARAVACVMFRKWMTHIARTANGRRRPRRSRRPPSNER